MSGEAQRDRREVPSGAPDLLDGIPLGIVVTDRSGVIQRINASAAAIVRRAGLAPPLRHARVLFQNQAGRPWENLSSSAGGGEICLHRISLGSRKVDLSVAPVTLAGDDVKGLVFTLRDMTETERKQALEKQSQTTAVLEKWSAQMAHEIRNPLGSIELFASLLKKDLKRKKDIGRIEQVLAAARSVEKKIAALILAGKAFQIPAEDVDLHEVLKDIMLFSERIIDRESVYLSVRYADIQPVIRCNAELIRQVFLNLILKALQTIQEPGRLDIVTRYLPERQAIEIHFIDNGPPAREGVRAPLFGPPLPPAGHSAGLDLAIVHNIVNLYGGTIRIEYVEGVGSAFIIAFPVKAVAP
jgi:signal transduction histidine kinase